MTSPITINTTEIDDDQGCKRLVESGEKVRLKPVRLREKDKEHGDYFAEKEYREQRAQLGNGSFIISSINRWPCGKVILHLKTRKGKHILNASDVV